LKQLVEEGWLLADQQRHSRSSYDVIAPNDVTSTVRANFDYFGHRLLTAGMTSVLQYINVTHRQTDEQTADHRAIAYTTF